MIVSEFMVLKIEHVYLFLPYILLFSVEISHTISPLPSPLAPPSSLRKTFHILHSKLDNVYCFDCICYMNNICICIHMCI